MNTQDIVFFVPAFAAFPAATSCIMEQPIYVYGGKGKVPLEYAANSGKGCTVVLHKRTTLVRVDVTNGVRVSSSRSTSMLTHTPIFPFALGIVQSTIESLEFAGTMDSTCKPHTRHI